MKSTTEVSSTTPQPSIPGRKPISREKRDELLAKLISFFSEEKWQEFCESLTPEESDAIFGDDTISDEAYLMIETGKRFISAFCPAHSQEFTTERAAAEHEREFGCTLGRVTGRGPVN